MDAIGELLLPQITFQQTFRVRTHVSVVPSAGAPISTRSVSFVAECFGAVATMRSRDEEPAEDFTTAVEVRRRGYGGGLRLTARASHKLPDAFRFFVGQTGQRRPFTREAGVCADVDLARG